MSYVFPVAGAAVALAGGDKLAGQRGYDRMFRHLGWSRTAVLAAATAEAAGGLLMIARPTRRLGGALVAGVSVLLLGSEMRHGDPKLAVPRGMVLLAGLLAVVTPGKR